MELNEFLEKFVPDYKKRAREFWINNQRDCLPNAKVILKIATALFPEALQAFADKICEKQMEIVMKGIEDNYQVTLDSFDVTKLTLEQPKID